MTGLATITADLSVDAARQITEELRQHVTVSADLIVEAYQGRVWIAMGYATWDAYTVGEFAGSLLRLPREERNEAIQSLRSQGLSLRAIASATGVSHTEAKRTLDSGVTNVPPAPMPAAAPTVPQSTPTPEPDEEVVDAEIVDEEIVDAEIVDDPSAPTAVVGTDGKTYKVAAKPQKPNRPPLPATAEKAGWDLRKSMDRTIRIVNDDRFAANKDQVAAYLRSHLEYTVEACQALLDQLTQ